MIPNGHTAANMSAHTPRRRIGTTARFRVTFCKEVMGLPFPIASVEVRRARDADRALRAAELGTTPYAIEHKLRRLRNQRPARAPAAVCRPLKLFDLRPHHCRWIVFGSGEGALFCGKPKAGTSPYCVEHTQRAWQRPNRKVPVHPTARRSHAA